MVMLAAVRMPLVVRLSPAAVTHDPTASSAAVAATVWVIVVALLNVTFTFLVVVFGLAFFFVGGVNTITFAVRLSPETLVIVPEHDGAVREAPPEPLPVGTPAGRWPLPFGAPAGS